MRCRVCESEASPGAKFCAQCGALLPAACRECGQLLADGARFCQHRGAPVTAAPARETPPPPAPAPAGYERRLMTVLFADIVNFSTLSEFIDPEELFDIMRGAYPCLLEPVKRLGGTPVQILGDGLLAFFGYPATDESDPERALLAGLEITTRIRGYAAQLAQAGPIRGFNVRVGINTGLVVVGEMYPDRRLESSALGDAVNLAARLQGIAPPGGVLCSRETYRHVRGLFDVQPQPPVAVKGRQGLVQTYLVLRPKPRPWHIRTRGVEGVESPMIGREPELLALQNLYQDAIHGGEPRLALVTGEAGLGKSRLLDEFIAWVDLQPETVIVLRGRVTPNAPNTPFSLLRDLFANRFEILDSDPPAQAQDKFRQGMQGLLEAHQADIVGQMVGFDFSGSPAVARLLGSSSIAQMGTLYLLRYFRRLAAHPALLLLEDLHWADDSSLDLLARLAVELAEPAQAQIMIACAARPELFERRPAWADGVGAVRLELRPLSRSRSRTLVGNILSHVSPLPAALVERVVEEAEGSPFFIEELILMLIEEGVIETGDLAWQIHPERLAALHIPPTLAGLLQARLDGLPPAERAVLQRAAVVGRVFWDALVAHLTADPAEAAKVDQRLAALAERELIYRRERSSIAGAQEYAFNHALLRDAAYETVLLKQRRAYHSQVAQWIEAQAGERLEEHQAQIAAHFAEGGQPLPAADAYTRAGERALQLGLLGEARRLFDQALALVTPDDLPRRWRALFGRSEVLSWLSDIPARHADDQALLALAQQTGDPHWLAWAHFRIGCQAQVEGHYEQALASMQAALTTARQSHSLADQASILPMLVFVLARVGDLQTAGELVEPALATARQTGDLNLVSRALANLSTYYLSVGDLPNGIALLEQQVEICHQRGYMVGEALGLSNLGYQTLLLGRFAAGREMLEQALQLARELGARHIQAYCMLNLALADWRLGATQSALQTLQASLPDLEATRDRIGLASRLLYLGLVYEQCRNLPQAEESYSQALEMFTQAEAAPQVIDAQAGLARIALLAGAEAGITPSAQASARQRLQARVDQVAGFLQQHSPQGLELPLLAYLTCVQVYQALADPTGAAWAIQAGQAELSARAQRLSDPLAQETYLDAIPEHRELLRLAAARLSASVTTGGNP
ncbi:MAG: ATP-binding protein [Chloroflexota bacterium]